MTSRVVNLFLGPIVVGLTLADNYIDLSAFNIQVLGRTKMSRPDVVYSLVKVTFYTFEVDLFSYLKFKILFIHWEVVSIFSNNAANIKPQGF